ncbi:hypothetical protein E4U30_002794 [Claviceps sp. LM220 group G6]|nr:hypothetical protein E4U15_007492 [Claviceps sp. LM218 group G6]KAG6095059.1 hypothetical protein E4U30_002794 [Claviceps sp. LM220 group G6]KAG6103302.1 hypothetical protein E4U31_002915 [Claviceps sp. LM219 group G6]
MYFNAILFNLLLTSLAAARYVPSDPATCSKDPNKRDVTAQDETEAIIERNPMGDSVIEGRDSPKVVCQRCCQAATMFCLDACSAAHNGGGGASFWALAACQASCQAWGVTCVAKC